MSNIRAINPKEEGAFTADIALNMEAYLVISRTHIQYAARSISEKDSVYIAVAQQDNQAEGGMQELFWEYPLFALPYKSTLISVDDGSSFVAVPHDLLNSSTNEEWLGIATDLRGRRVLSDDLEEERLSIIHSIGKELFDFCQRSFSIPSYSHSITPLVSLSVRLTRRDVERIVILHHLGEFIQVVIASEGQLLLANGYRVESDIDTLYYITALFRQFKFNPQSTPFLVYSRENINSLLDLLRATIGDIRVNWYPFLSKEFQQNKSVESLNPQLVLQLLCE